MIGHFNLPRYPTSASEPCRYACATYEPQRICTRSGGWAWKPGTTATHHALTADELLALLTTWHEAPEKFRVPAWSPAWLQGDRRCNESVRWISCAVLDIDDGTPLREAADRWRGFVLIAHTSWSHTPEHPKGRIVLPLAAPVPAEWWPRAWAEVQRRAGQIDLACKDASRVYLLPGHLPGKRADHDAWLDAGDGRLLDLRPFEDLPLTAAEQAEEAGRVAREEAPRGRWRPDAPDPADRIRVYCHGALRHAADRCAQAPEGQRNSALTREAYVLGGYVAAGHLVEADVLRSLTEAGVASGLDPSEAGSVVARQLAAGKLNPHTPTLADR